jgi:methionyl-tRNA synthetase
MATRPKKKKAKKSVKSPARKPVKTAGKAAKKKTKVAKARVKAAPKKATGKKVAPKKAAPKKAAPKKAAPKKAASEKLGPKKLASAQLTPKKTALKKAAPTKAATPTTTPKPARKPVPGKPVVAAQPTPKPSAASEKPRYYITTSIAYPNGPPHIGYGYEVICTDAIARFKRLDGYDVFFLTGTDEHGIKLWQTANKLGIAPRALVDQNTARFREMAERLDASNDAFIRTTEERHHKSSQAIWQRMQDAGDIYLDKYAGWYSVRDEAYYDESETKLEGDVRLGPLGTPVEWVEEESYFFRLSAFQDRLLELYETVPDFVLPKERFNEVISFVKGGLQDLSISRTTFDWGVKVPTDPKHVMYVWVDALTNYITGVGYPDTDSAMFKRYWPADLHVIGKDIVRFHAVYWPAFLMSAGIEVPRHISCHGWILNRGEKMSKSVGNVVDPFDLVNAYGVDPLRYFFLREVSYGQDGNYSHEQIVARINADLANDLGNLAQRSLTMLAKQRGGVVPTPGAFSANDQTILAAADAMIGKAREAMKTQALHQVLNAVWAVVADANRYFAGEAPWALAKTDPERQGTVLYVTAEVIRQVALLAQPFMPKSATKLLDLLAVPSAERDFSRLGGGHRLASGVTLPPPAPVFPRYVEPEAAAS